MLDDAIAAYLDSVSERAFYEPLLALLRAEGYADIHLTHGTEEFGKDAIAKRDELQWAFQVKVGNIAQADWRREVRGQLDDLRLSKPLPPCLQAAASALPRRASLVVDQVRLTRVFRPVHGAKRRYRRMHARFQLNTGHRR